MKRTPKQPKQGRESARLEYLRAELRAERISYAEIAELQSLKAHITPDDVELLEAAGVPEFPRMSFTEATARYVHRFTMEHVPDWALRPAPSGKYYAPQFRSDREWYDNTKFPPDPVCFGTDCHTSGQTWPLGQWLEEPYKRS